MVPDRPLIGARLIRNEVQYWGQADQECTTVVEEIK
jgi:hypothetical protein